MTITNVGWEDPRTDYGDFVNGQYATDSPSVNANLFNTLCSILANSVGKFAPRAQDTPDMTIAVSAGVAYFGDTLVAYAGGNSSAMSAPAANPRIDRVYLTGAGALAITTGSEAASPVAPAIVNGTFPICLVYHRVGSVHIDDADDSSNSYIYRDDRAIFQSVESSDAIVRLQTTVTHADGANTSLGTCPAHCILMYAAVSCGETWNGSAPTIDIGTSGDADAIFANTDIGMTSGDKETRFHPLGDSGIEAATEYFADVVPDGSTTGETNITLLFASFV